MYAFCSNAHESPKLRASSTPSWRMPVAKTISTKFKDELLPGHDRPGELQTASSRSPRPQTQQRTAGVGGGSGSGATTWRRRQHRSPWRGRHKSSKWFAQNPRHKPGKPTAEEDDPALVTMTSDRKWWSRLLRTRRVFCRQVRSKSSVLGTCRSPRVYKTPGSAEVMLKKLESHR